MCRLPSILRSISFTHITLLASTSSDKHDYSLAGLITRLQSRSGRFLTSTCVCVSTATISLYYYCMNINLLFTPERWDKQHNIQKLSCIPTQLRCRVISWSWLRIPGVLQRLGFTYFVLALMQTFSTHREIPLKVHHWWNPVQDVVLYWPEWLFIALLEIVWLCVTFFMPVPNCPTGYLGAGGIGDDGLYSNCTGGAAAYIDRWLLGDKIYWHPSCKVLYRTTEPFDPEGVLGTINSIVMGFFGMQAGKILLFFRERNRSVLTRFLAWALILGISAAILSKCTRDEGFIPVNKNLWSLSYVTCMGFMSFVLLGVMYFVMDIKKWWGGQPFIYPGMNSIFVYVGHSLLGFYFPFSWETRFHDSHWEKLFQNLWGTSLWVFIAYLLYRKRFFLKI
ncbi:Heparan-alpha-glucosaminide N-acetyltransferase [Triplophysa tibetana]|uniref:Heparan-alpha-glucosaminide N-acetyltransferase n=1 Tax=Triplophysa tibetana TaxID=1572043 RepID=A0A5A9PAB9_9TELE|nr:Heparan-alpha-glucosaminide N-acetyltransferase [Triplophysa tibetana]